MATTADFDQAFELLIGHEGGYSNDPRDPGNWTGGQVNSGICKGTKFGIAANSYPNEDIPNLTLEQAKAIYFRDYWSKAGCPDMPPRLAFQMFDCGVNNGTGRAVRFLQGAVGAGVDGAYGPQTKAALDRKLATDRLGMELANEVHAQRIFFMAKLSTWDTFGLGWSRRLAAIPHQAAHYWPASDLA